MKILDIKVLRGPNYWSNNRHKLIVLRLDLEDFEQKPSNLLPGFNERLKNLIPTLFEHECSEGHEGGFFERLDEGTWMGHIIEHVALEVQTLAGMDCGFGRTRGDGEEGVYNVVFTYTEEKAGRYIAEAAVKIVETLATKEYTGLQQDIQKLKEIREADKLGPSTSSIVEEAKLRGIPFIRLNRHSLVQLGYGVNQKRIAATITSQTSGLGVDIACDKEDTKFLLKKAAVPVPDGCVIQTKEELIENIESIGYPCVIKPVDGNHGRGVTTEIKNAEQALVAFKLAKLEGDSIILESFVDGFDFRLLVINHKLVAAAKRTPAQVKGNGILTIGQLIHKVNLDPRRGFGHENMLTEITVDKMTEEILKSKGYSLDTKLPKNEVLALKSTANLSTGGTSEDITDSVHPYNVFIAERVSRIIGLDVCGIDLMAADLRHPIKENGGRIIEVNAAPGFRMHLDPTIGVSRDIAKPLVEMLYPKGSSSKIPIVAVTGTNGKTTTTRLIAHILKNSGFKVGYTTSDGIYIQNRMLEEGDCTGPKSAKFVLEDPTVDFAVLETARGGILREGLGFNKCDIGIITNISADHLGLKGIHSVEQMARVKSVVVENVYPEGYAILNADDELVLGTRENITSKVALFSLQENNKHVLKHCKKGGIAALCENGYITINKGGWEIRVEKVVDIPLTFGGKAEFMIQNVLPAVLTAFLRDISIEDIKLSLQTFIPSPVLTPGRMNMFRFKKFEVLLDYAHNPSGMKAIGDFISKVEAYPKVGIIAGTGDRRDEDMIELGAASAAIFDEIIIRQDPELRGRTADEIAKLLMKGIKKIDKSKKVRLIENEYEAIKLAIDEAKTGTFIVVTSDSIEASITLIRDLQTDESSDFKKGL